MITTTTTTGGVLRSPLKRGAGASFAASLKRDGEGGFAMGGMDPRFVGQNSSFATGVMRTRFGVRKGKFARGLLDPGTIGRITNSAQGLRGPSRGARTGKFYNGLCGADRREGLLTKPNVRDPFAWHAYPNPSSPAEQGMGRACLRHAGGDHV